MPNNREAMQNRTGTENQSDSNVGAGITHHQCLTFSPSDHLLFISDLHLEPKRPDITATLLTLLNRISDQTAWKTIAPKATAPFEINALFILGDFFEVWVGDDHQTELSNTIAEALAHLADQGIKLYFLAGNRDFLLGDAYCQQAKLTRITEPLILEIIAPGQPATRYGLMHGDSLCTNDHAYMKFRKMVRNPQWQQQFLSQSLEHRLAVARSIRENSEQRKQQHAAHEEITPPDNLIMDVAPETVAAQFAELKVTTIIHGHTHRPQIHHNQVVDGPEAHTRAVLGDWDTQGWTLLLNQNQLTLQAFPLA